MDDQIRKTQIEWVAQSDADKYTGTSHNGKPVMQIVEEIFVAEGHLEGITDEQLYLTRRLDQILAVQGLHRISEISLKTKTPVESHYSFRVRAEAIRVELPMALRKKEEPQ